MDSKLENIEAICLIMILCINGIILSTSKYLVDMCSSSSLINVVIISIVSVLITFIICILLKNFSSKDILFVSEFLANKMFKFLVGFIYIIYFLFLSTIFLKKISNCMQIIYFPMTNVIFIVLLFCIFSGLLSILKNNAVIKSNVIIIPIVFLTIILVFLGNLKNYSFENIYPLLGNGISSTFFSGMSNLFAFSGLSYILFLPSRIKHPENLAKIAFSGIVLSSIFLLISIVNIILLFGSTLSGSELFPLYISVRYIEFGTFFQRLDSVFLFICILSSLSFFSINTVISLDILKDILNLSDNKPLVFPYMLILISCSLLIKKDSTLMFLEYTVFRILFALIGLALPVLILILANIKKFVVSSKLNIHI